MSKGIKVPEVAGGVAHKMPEDLRKALLSSVPSLTAWENITPLARNEWICWVEAVKREETRVGHIKRVVSELKEGKRRPCCWIGCTHRTDKLMSASQKFMQSRFST